jgi:hypothetical protein
LQPVLYMEDASFAWVAVKFTTSENPTMSANVDSRNFYLSQSDLTILAGLASDILMIEQSSRVFAHMKSLAAFLTVRNNILNGCAWFKDTDHLPLTYWMSPYDEGYRIPDATGVGYACGGPQDWKSVFQSGGNSIGSHTGMDNRWRLRVSLDYATYHFWNPSVHSIWLLIPMSYLCDKTPSRTTMKLSSSLILTSSTLKVSFIRHECVAIASISITGIRFFDFNATDSSVMCLSLNTPMNATVRFHESGLSNALSLIFSPAITFQPGCHFDCEVSGFTNSQLAAPASISTMAFFNDHGNLLRTTQLEFPAIFDAELSGGHIALSSYLASPDAPNGNVTLFISFAPMASARFKAISVSGLRFLALNDSSDQPFSETTAHASCMNIDPSNAKVWTSFEVSKSTSFESSSGILLLNLSSAATPASASTNVLCTVSGFTNSNKPGAASASVSVSTFDDRGHPLRTQSKFWFPELLRPRVLSHLSSFFHPSTAQMSISVHGWNAGLHDWSGRVRIGLTACTSASWLSDTLVTCRTASGAGFRLSAESSVLLNQGRLPFAFSYNPPSMSTVLGLSQAASSGAMVVNVAGRGLGLKGFSAVSRLGGTACAASFWRCDSVLICRVASGLFGGSHAILGSAGAQQFGILNAALSYNFPRVTLIHEDKGHSNFPTTGSSSAFVIGRHFGSSTISAHSIVFTRSSCQASLWFSDSCLHLRTSSGVAASYTSLMVSFSTHTNSINATMITTLSSAVSYNTPSPSTVTSQRLSNISVSGSNFGTYLAAISRETRCPSITTASWSSAFICHSYDLNIRDAGMAVTEAAVTVVFSDVSRLDDVIISLRSPSGKNFTLMQNKCFGALPCGPLNSVAFNFQILPITSLTEVPLVKCPSSGIYLSDTSDITLLRSALLSHTAVGDWSLQIATGTLQQTITNASIYFKTANLDFQIGNSPVSSLLWFSDSSVSIKVPGYIDEHGLQSSSGWGRNHTVIGLSSGLHSASSCTFSYPDPEVVESSLTAGYISSGSSKLLLVGRYFANTNTNPRGCAGSSVCVMTLWQSDTAISCALSPSFNSIRSFAVTVGRSAVATLTASFQHFPTVFGIINSSFTYSATASSLVTIVGAGFGVWDDTLRARMPSLTLADATVWLCDTSVSTKFFHSLSRRPGVLISLASVVKNISLVSQPKRVVAITAINSSNQDWMGTSGSNLVFLNGINFGAFTDSSVCLKLSLSSAQYSAWSSDSSIRSKSSWGFRVQTPELIVSTELNRGNSPTLFNLFLNSNVHHVTVANESSLTVLHANGSNMSPFQLQALVKIDDRDVTLNWTSDSSFSCASSWPVSRDSLNLNVHFFDLNNQLLFTSTPINPLFIASSKSISESFNVILYLPAPPEVISEVDTFVKRGKAMNWMFPIQKLSTPPSFFESELIDIDVAVYNNHTQVYLKDYQPIGVDFHSSILLHDSANKLLNELVCHGKSFMSRSMLLPPQLFATFFRSSFALCSIPRSTASLTLTIVVIAQVRDEQLGAWLNFSSHRMSATIHARPQAVLAAKFTQTNFSAGVVNTAPMIVSLGYAGASCSRLVFEYTAYVSCFYNQSFVPVLFFPNGSCADGKGVISLRNQIERSCDIDLRHWVFGAAGTCQIIMNAVLFNSSLSIPILVNSGDPYDFVVIGQLQSQLNAGGVIWSSNASVLKCLELSFQDKCNNTLATDSRREGGFSCRLSASLSNTSQYTLLGQTNVDADEYGRCIWCSARVSLTVPLLVRLQVQWLNSDRYLEPLVNVSGRAEAAVLSLASPSFNNQTKAGNVLAPITFKLFDANGAAAAASNTVIRVRIIRKNKANAAAR